MHKKHEWLPGVIMTVMGIGYDEDWRGPEKLNLSHLLLANRHGIVDDKITIFQFCIVYLLLQYCKFNQKKSEEDCWYYKMATITVTLSLHFNELSACFRSLEDIPLAVRSVRQRLMASCPVTTSQS